MAKKYIPKLYDSDEVTLIDDIHDVIECKIREERNGIFELTLDYPASSPLLYEFKKERIIVANASPKLRNQMFVVYKVCRYMKKKIKVIARHISFDLLYDSCSELKLENASCEYVLNSLFRNSRFSHEFRGFSDIINAQNYSIENVNILEAIAGKEGSIIDTFGTGAEILRDNKNFHVLNKRGHDNGVSIEYGINLTGFECYEDTTDLVTCIRPFAIYRKEDSTEITVRGDFIDSPRAGNYKHLYIKHIDYTNKFEAKEVPTPAKLNELAAQDFRTGSIDIPKMRYEIKFIPLSQCVGYENFQDAIGLCDIVTVKNRVYNVDDKAKVVATVFDPIKDRYESMELGEPRSTLGSILSGSDGKDGQNGKDGKDGKDGQDGNVENMPDTLPETPILYSKVYGMGGLELSWSFENKLYYNYELYASRIPDFNPTAFDLIHSGQSSSHFFKANPGETWYFRVCAINSHSKRTPFSNQVVITLPKVEDMNNYFSEMAIGKAVVQSLSADYMEAGIIKGHWIDMRHLTLTDGNGKRVFDVDDFGKMYADIHTLKIKGEDIGSIYANKTELSQTANELELKATSIQENMLSNSNGFDGQSWWGISNANLYIRTPQSNPEIARGFQLINKSNIGIRFSQELNNLEAGTWYTFQLNCNRIEANVLNGYRVTLQDNTDNSVVYNSGNITTTGTRQFKFKVSKPGSYKLGIWHNGASQENGSVIGFDDWIVVKGEYDYKLNWVDNANDKASISVKANQITNKVSSDDVSSIIEQNPKSVEVAFNSITSNVQNTSGKFIIRNGAIELYNNQGLNCFSMEPSGWLKVWGLKVYGPQNPIQFTGDGHKGIEINANNGYSNYIDFSDNSIDQDYVCRIIRQPNTNYLSILGGLEVRNSPTVATARLELRSTVGGDSYMDFAHDSSEDYQARIFHHNGEKMLRFQGSGISIEGNGGRLYANIIGRSTNIGTQSIYITDNIDMGGRVIYNSNIVTPAVYSPPTYFSFAVMPTKNTVSDVIDNIKFNETIDSDNIVGLEMDLSNVLDTSFVVMDEEANAYGDMQNLLKLALKEIQGLKKEVSILKEKVGV